MFRGLRKVGSRLYHTGAEMPHPCHKRHEVAALREHWSSAALTRVSASVPVPKVCQRRSGERFLVPGRRSRRHDAGPSWQGSDAPRGEKIRQTDLANFPDGHSGGNGSRIAAIDARAAVCRAVNGGYFAWIRSDGKGARKSWLRSSHNRTRMRCEYSQGVAQRSAGHGGLSPCGSDFIRLNASPVYQRSP